MNKTILATAFIGLFFPATLLAAPLAITNTFQSDTPAVAADVNQNFNDVEAAVNDNNKRITTNEGVINTQTTAISANTSALSANTSDISSNAATISSNTSRIGISEVGIAGNASSINANAAVISSNTSAISSGAASISSNTSRITANEGNISSNTSGVSANTVAIGTNTSSISANTANISTNTTASSTNASAISNNTARITVSENDIAGNAAGISTNSSEITSHASSIASNSSDIATNVLAIANNAADIATLNSSAGNTISGSVYRWNVFSTYGQISGWMTNNTASLYGGVNPSTWSDGNGLASQMSSDKDVLRTLFTRKGYAGNNALVFADEWLGYSSTNGKHVVALLRIKNTTGTDIQWTPMIHVTAFPGWGERASVAINGVEVWQSGGTTYRANTAAVATAMQIPANRTSTVIFVSSSSDGTSIASTGIYTRTTLLAFTNNSLALPPGLEYVDDLDTATGGWEQ